MTAASERRNGKLRSKAALRCYRLYCLDGVGRIQLAQWIDAVSDDEAISKVRELTSGTLVRQIWLKSRLVATIKNHNLEPA